MMSKFVELLDNMVDAYKSCVDSMREFEEVIGISVCEPSWIQLHENGETSPFKVCSELDIKPKMEDRADKYTGFYIHYKDVTISWLVG